MSTKTKPPDKGGTELKSKSDSKSKSPNQNDAYQSTVTIEVPKWLFYSTSVFIGFISILIGCYITYTKMVPPGYSREIIMNVGEEGIKLFELHDRNRDGYLSIEEFEPFIYRLLETNVTGIVYEAPIEKEDEVLAVRAFFEPLILETMTKDFSEQFSNYVRESIVCVFGGIDSFNGLKNWKRPSVDVMNFGARHFSVFLPPDPHNVELGMVYYIVEAQSGVLDSLMGAALSSNRYYPPKVPELSVTIHRLLSMFHSRPFLISRFAPVGSVACVRAYNDKLLDIHFRIHAEFQLNEPPYHPYWFTPGQFMGNIIISRDGSHVQYFNLYVPNDKKLNVDMEWLNGPKEAENMEVDIGYMPLMQLNISAASKPNPNPEIPPEDLDIHPDPKLATKVQNIQWSSAMSVEDAQRQLEIKMYPFKKVPYYNFSSVFSRAEEDKKLVHSILLWGALDDQSC